MKRYLLSILLLSISARVAAQHFEFGLNGGVVGSTVQNVYTDYGLQNCTMFQSSVMAPVESAVAMYDTRHYQYGIAVENRTYTYKGVNYPDFPPILMEYPTIQYKDQENPVKLLVNRVFRFKRLVVYGGVAAAYVFSKTTGRDVSSSILLQPVPVTTAHDNRLAADLHIGATYFVTKHIGINGEVSASYDNLPESSPLSKNSFSFPMTLGIRYQL